ncbi:MAG: hypothetical protein Q9164_000110 [Protoblastenia rupestris]
MPGQGDQHNDLVNGNPFEETKPHFSEYTATEIATLSSRLEKQLGPEYISSRPGAGGGKVDENQTTGKVCVGLSVIVRVTLRDGTFHEDIGYGHIENCKGKAPAFEKAKKEGTTDALKRALRNFGNLLGNCVYDKDYVARVTKLKTAPTKWDPERLHRHHDFAPQKKETLGLDQVQQPSLPSVKCEKSSGREDSHEDEFGSDDFDEVDFAVPEEDHPDEVTTDPATESARFGRRTSLPHKRHEASNHNIKQTDIPQLHSPAGRNQSTAPTAGPQTPAADGRLAIPANISQPQRRQVPPFPQQESPNISAHASPTVQAQPVNQQPAKAHPDYTPSLNSSNTSEHEPPIGFFTARAAETLQNPQSALKAPLFNPHLESPSIRKTAGVDHTKTKPVNRDLVGAPTAISNPPPRGPNFVNPQADKARKVGMPGQATPLQNRGSYKPPQIVKRPNADSGRLALGDVTSASVNVLAINDCADIKRQRIGDENLSGEAGMLNV